MDFAGALQTWIGVLTRPGEEVFQQEKMNPNANLVTAIIWVAIVAFISSILGWLRFEMMGGASAVEQMLSQSGLPPEMVAQFNAIGRMGATGIGGVLLSIITGMLFFLIGVGILHLVARVLGGDGAYSVYAYLMAAIYVPVALISAILSLIPLLGSCLGSILSIYGIVLAVFATKVNYMLSTGKAIVVVLIPVIVILLLVLCAAAVGAAMVLGMNG
jgi:hypothetical protein